MSDRSPYDVVMEQIAAYNARDVEAFVDTYDEEATVYRVPEEEPILQGRTAMQESYGKMFASCPHLHCEVVDRLSWGPYVTLIERVSGQLKLKPYSCQVLYEVEKGRIRRVWLMTDPGAPPAEA